MATDVEIVRFEADVTNLKNGLKESEKAFTKVEDKAVKSAKTTEKAYSQLGDKLKSITQSLPFGHLVDDLEQAGDAAKSLGGSIGGISGKSDQASGGIKNLTKLIGVGMLGAIGLVIAAFASVIAFIKQTDEGGTKLESTMKGVGASISVLTGRFAEWGAKISESFSNADGLGNKLWEGIKTGFSATNPLIALLGKAIGKTGLAQDMKDAYDRAYELTTQLDAINDQMRVFSLESKKGDFQIQALLKQTRNRGIEISQRLDIVNQAQELENSLLQKNFELEKQRYENIAQTNLLSIESINSSKTQNIEQIKGIVNQIKTAQNVDQLIDLYNQQIKAQEGLLSINDEQAQAQVDSLKGIIELEGRSVVLSEKYASIKSNLIEQEIAERTNAIKEIERAQEATAIKTIKDSEQLESRILEIKLNSLNSQRRLAVQYGKDVSAIDLEIATLLKKYEDDVTKRKNDELQKRLADERAYQQEQKRLADENYKKQVEDIDANYKARVLGLRNQNKTAEQIQREELQAYIGVLEAKKLVAQQNSQDTLDIELELQQKKKELYQKDVENLKASEQQKKQIRQQLAQLGFNAASAIGNEFAQRASVNAQNEITDAQNVSRAKQEQLRIQLEQGLISQQRYAAELKLLQDKQLREERIIKNRQAKAERDYALFNIALDTAQAVIGALAQTPLPVGAPIAIATAAFGALQAALVASRPLPKFKDGVIDMNGKGTETSDSNLALLSKGESVMTAKETKENKSLLWAVRRNKLDEYAEKTWVMPAIEALNRETIKKERRNNITMQKLAELNNEVDTSAVERLLRKNKSVRIENLHELERYMKGGRNIV